MMMAKTIITTTITIITTMIPFIVLRILLPQLTMRDLLLREVPVYPGLSNDFK